MERKDQIKLVKQLLAKIKAEGVYFGLCHIIVLMHMHKEITETEMDFLLDVIELYKPRHTKYVSDMLRSFYFPQGNVPQRIKFLEEILTKL